MVKKLSDLNASLTYVTSPLSVDLAGVISQVATNDSSLWLLNNWLECDGSAISRTTYADLFANIGTKYGIGDGSTTFNLAEWAVSNFSNRSRKFFELHRFDSKCYGNCHH